MAPASFIFQVTPTSGVPIYRQLMEQVRAHLATRRLAVGEFLPSVRTVAQQLAVNPMTVSKAYSLLEREGIVESIRGQGMKLVSPAAPYSVRQRKDALMPLLEQVVAAAYQNGLSAEQVIEWLVPLLEEMPHEQRTGSR